MDNDFDSVSWQNDEPEDEASRPSTAITNEPGEPVYGANASGKRKASNAPNQAGEQADAVDLAGIGEARLDLKVDKPLKENDGTKDAYISYLVTTHVRLSSTPFTRRANIKVLMADLTFADQLQILLQTDF